MRQYEQADDNIAFPNRILFEGDNGRIFVNLERLSGKPVEEMTDTDNRNLYDEVVEINGSEPGNHMKNIFESIKIRKQPISDVETHDCTMTTCHLCNISQMLGRELRWDPPDEQFVGDDQAMLLMSRPRREKYSWQSTT